MSGIAIQISCRFVGQNQPRSIHESPSDCHALLLAPRQCVRPMIGTVRDAENVEKFESAPAHLPEWTLLDNCRHRHVLKSRELGQQVVKLEYESDVLVAKLRQVRILFRKDVVAFKQDVTTIRSIKSAEQV